MAMRSAARWRAGSAGWEVISWALVFSAPVMLALVLLSGPINWSASRLAWAGFLYVSVFSMFLGFFAWNKGLAMGGIAKSGRSSCCSRSWRLPLCAPARRDGRVAGDRVATYSWWASWRWAGGCGWCVNLEVMPVGRRSFVVRMVAILAASSGL